MTKVVITDGVRTPFCLKGMELAETLEVELGRCVTRELLERAEMTSAEPQLLIWAGEEHGLAQKIATKCGLEQHVACISLQGGIGAGLNAFSSAYFQIAAGDIDIAVVGASAGRADGESASESEAPRPISEKITRLPAGIRDLRDRFSPPSAGTGYWERRRFLLEDVRAGDDLAARLRIFRPEQEDWTRMSVARAARAIKEGIWEPEIVTTYARPDFRPIISDTGLPEESSLNGLAALAALHPGNYMSITAATAAPLADGAAAIMLMSEKSARRRISGELTFISGYRNIAVPDRGRIAPSALAAQQVLDANGLAVTTLDLLEIDERFAAGALFIERFLSGVATADLAGKSTVASPVSREKINPNGGALAVGYPVAVGDLRMLLTLHREMTRRQSQRGLLAASGSANQGRAVVLTRE